MLNTEKTIAMLVFLLAFGCVFCACAAAQKEPDVIKYHTGSVRDDGRVVEETIALIRYKAFDKIAAVDKIPQDKVGLVVYYDEPEDYIVGRGYLKRLDYDRAYSCFEKALEEYDPAKHRSWVPQYCLYQMADCLKIQGLLESDAEKSEAAARLFERLWTEYPSGKFALTARYEAGVCFSSAASYKADKKVAGELSEAAAKSFAELRTLIPRLLAGDEFRQIRADWTARAKLGECLSDLRTADTVAGFKLLKKRLAELAGGLKKDGFAAFEVRSGAIECEYGIARLDNAGWDATETRARALVEEVYASNVLSENDKALLISRLYLLIGDNCLERSSSLPKKSPLRRKVILTALGAYLRIPLIHGGKNVVAPELARALFNAAQAFSRMGDGPNARRVLQALISRFNTSKYWQKKSRELYSKIS